MIKITKVVPELDIEGSGEYEFGSNLDEAIELFGKEVVYGYFIGKAKISAAGVLKSAMVTKKDGKKIASGASPDKLQAALDAWKPGIVRTSGESKKDKALEFMAAQIAAGNKDAVKDFLKEAERLAQEKKE